MRQKKRKIRFIFGSHSTASDAKEVDLRRRIANSKFLYLESHGNEPMIKFAKEEFKKLQERKIKPKDYLAADAFEKEIIKEIEGRRDLKIELEPPDKKSSPESLFQAQADAELYFTMGSFDRSIEKTKEHSEDLVEVIKRRDKAVIEDLKEKYAKADADIDVIFGMGHTKIYHDIKKAGIPAEMVKPKRKILFSPMEELPRRAIFNKPPTPERKRWLLAANIPFELVCTHLELRGITGSKVQNKATEIVSRMKYSDFKELSKYLGTTSGLTREEASDLAGHWMKKRGFIKEKEI